jgi:tetratricopeptide (TPR) repeat protein
MAQTAPNLFRGGRPVSRATARARPGDTRSASRTVLTGVVAAAFGAATAAAVILLLLPHLRARGESARVEEAEKRVAEFDKALKLLKAQRDEAYAENRRLLAANPEPAGETAEKSAAEAGGETDGNPDGKPDEETGQATEEATDERQATPLSSEAVDMTLASLTLLERRVDLELALALADAAVRSAPALPAAHRVRGGVLAALGRAKDALAAFEAASEAARTAGLSGDIEALVLAAEVYLTQLGDSRTAAIRYAEAAAVAPDSPLGLAAKAAELRIKGDLDGAATEAGKAREASPSLALASLVLGEIAFERALLETGARRRDLLAEAGPLLAEAVRLEPNSARACLVRGRMLIEESELAAASRGFGLARFESQGEAARLLQRATRLSPDLAGAYVALADLRLKKGALRDPAAAVELARDAVKLTKCKDVEALVTLAAARAATGNPSAAARAVKEALKLAPKDGELQTAYRKYRSEARAIGR